MATRPLASPTGPALARRRNKPHFARTARREEAVSSCPLCANVRETVTPPKITEAGLQGVTGLTDEQRDVISRRDRGGRGVGESKAAAIYRRVQAGGLEASGGVHGARRARGPLAA